MKNIFILIISVIILSQVLTQQNSVKSDPQIPAWPLQWQQEFEEVKMDTGVPEYSKGIHYYDYESGRQRVDRTNGQVQFLCGSVTDENTPCSDIIVGGKRYLLFNEYDHCCYCCGAQDGCGILYPNWQQKAFAKYLGIKERKHIEYNVWETLDGGGDPIMSWYNAESNIQSYIDRYESIDVVQFDQQSWREYIEDPSVLDLPEQCIDAPYCPNDSKCGLFRGDQNKNFIKE